MASDDLAEALELRDELLVACREVLLQVGTRQSSSLVAAIDALLDLDDEAVPGVSALTFAPVQGVCSHPFADECAIAGDTAAHVKVES